MARLNEFVVANAYGFPQEGTLVDGHIVSASGVDIDSGRWFVLFDGTAGKETVKKALKPALGRTKYFRSSGSVYEVATGKKVKMETTRTNPSGATQTVVSGSITSTRVRKNPVSVSEFRTEMREMFVSDPRRDFKVIDSPKAHSPAFRDILFSFVSYRGESYGWLKGGKIYHRRGSLIMPKLKVNRAVEGSTAFYHTHPSKDEPSLSSADDYQFYLDLAFAFGIKHFYTVMENRIDHFQFTVKKSTEEDYLKMDEDKLLDDINAIIDGAEADISKKHKGDKNMPDEDFYAKMTAETVKRFNKRFSEYVTVKYKGHARPGIVRENPSDAGFRHNPPIRISHIHKASQLEELRDTTNNFEHYGANEYGHSQYVYWWVDHHFSLTPLHPHGRLFKLKELGLDDETRRKLRDYMSEEVAPGYSHLDMLLLLSLYHDVGKVREKETGVHHSIIASEMFQNEIGPELGLPPEIIDACALLMLTDCGRRDITPEAFVTQAGDYLPVAYMLQMADMLAHHPFMFTSRASEAKKEGLIDKANVEEYKKKIARDHFANIKKFLDTRVKVNPPPSVSYIVATGSYETPIDGDLADEFFGEEWINRKASKEGLYHNGQLRLRDPESGLAFAVDVKNGNFRMYVKNEYFSDGDEFGLDTARDIYTRVGRILSEFTPGIRVEDIPEPEILVNPRHSKEVHVITVSGPSGVGKSTIARTLAHQLDAALIPTVTTRPKRPREKVGVDRVFVSEKKFREMIEAGELVEWRKQKNGHFYGRRFSDFTKPIAVVDVSLKGMRKYREAFPSTTTIFLDPDVTPDQLAKRILRRGGMTKEEAQARARIASKQIADAHEMDFDMYVKSKTGNFEGVAKQIADDIVLENPPTKFGMVTRQRLMLDVNPTLDTFLPETLFSKAVDKATVVHRDSNWIVVKLDSIGVLASYSHMFRDPKSLKLSTTDPGFRTSKARRMKHGSGLSYQNDLPMYFIGKANNVWPTLDEHADGYAIVAPKTKKHYPPGEFRNGRNAEVGVRDHFDQVGRNIPDELFAILENVAKKVSDQDLARQIKHLRTETPEYRTKFYMNREGFVKVPGQLENQDVTVDISAPEDRDWRVIAQERQEAARRIEQERMRAEQTEAFMSAQAERVRLAREAQAERDRKAFSTWGQRQDLKENPPIFEPYPSPSEYIARRVQSGSKLTPTGHQFANTISSSRRSGREIISLAFTAKVQDLYVPFKQDAKRIGFMAIKDHVNKRKFPRIPNWSDKVKGEWFNKVWTIDEMIANGGVCRHLALMSGLLLERAIQEGVLDGEVYYFRGDGHGWAVYRNSSGDYVIDPAQDTWGPLRGAKYYAGRDEEGNNKFLLYSDYVNIPNSLPMSAQAERGGLHSQASAELRELLKNPKSRQEWFEDWAKLINMKNKELKAFLESPLGKKAGLSPSEAKEQGIHSGRVSGRAILRMRKKIGLGGPKDYIKGPKHMKEKFALAQKKWNDNDWEWCARQVRFNKRFMGDWMGKRKGPLVRDGQPTRRLLALWVWGFDPWRHARKVEKRKTMPKCPKVPWIGMTEKRMYGVQKNEVRMNPPWSLEAQVNPYILLSEPWSGIDVPIDELLAPLILHLWENNVPTSYSDQGVSRGGYLVIRWPYDYAKPIIEKLAKEKIVKIDMGGVKLWKGGDRVYPENSITIRWKRGKETLEAIYKAFGLKCPKSREEAEKMVMEMLAKENPQTGLPGIGEPVDDPAEIQPHLDWPMWSAPVWTPRNLIPADAVFVRPKRGEPYYHIKQEDLDTLLASQEYLQAQEAHRQKVLREAQERKEELKRSGQQFLDDFRANPHHDDWIRRGAMLVYKGKHRQWDNGRQGIEAGDVVRVENVMKKSEMGMIMTYINLSPRESVIMTRPKIFSHRMVMEDFEPVPETMDEDIPDFLVNPPNIPFPIPEEYQEELERRLTEEMTRPGYRPHTIPEVIEEGLYDDSPADFSYAQGEYEEFLEEIEKGDFDEAYAEYSDVEGHVAYWLYTNHRIIMPIYAQSHLAKTRGRIQIFKDLFEHYGYEHSPAYLKSGSNYEKVFKVRAALDAAADAQGKPRVKDSDEQLSAVVRNIVEARQGSSTLYPDDLAEAFEQMKRVAKKNRELEMTEGFDAYAWWKKNKSIIDDKYGKDPVEGASWLMPIYDPNFDPHVDENDPSMDDFHPNGEPNMHFYNQLMRIPQTEQPTPRKILQIALNIGQGHAVGIVDEDYTMSDFIAFDNPRKIVISHRDEVDDGIEFKRIDAHLNGKNVGFLSWFQPSQEKIMIHYLKVDKNHRKQGIGKQLLEELQSLPQVKGKKIHLHAPMRGGPREWTSQWYERLGFVTVEEESNEMVLQNPRTPGGKKFPTRYLTGLTKLEKMIAEDEIDKGYKYDADDPKAYEFWKSDIKATARGMKIGPSKHRIEYYKRYRKNIDKDYKPSGNSPKRKFINRIVKETGIKRSIIEKIYDKGLAAWRVGHRPGVQQHQWAAGRVYAFVVGADSSTGPGKPDNKLAVEAGVRKK